MPRIQCLSKHVADLIAAGEVVERPASVMKELLENAIDAGADAIVAELEKGGMTYLRITDNGCGIPPQELPTAFLRHATSKLRTADDLAAIGTLGFRGEALAAIAAVSRVDVFSRCRDAQSGATLHLEGGVPGEVTETGCPEGTTICVRDLFYNTPARLKFMRKDSSEGSAASAVVQHLALSHPHISFKLIRDGSEVLHTPGDGQLLSAVYAAMGRQFAMSLLPLRGTGGEVSVEGFVTKPLYGHGTRARQVFFVNGRFVRSQLLQAALEEAYRNRLLKGKFPGCVVHITLPAEQVDVNVHPAKTVVKFVSDKTVFDALYYTVKDALDREDAPAQPQRQESFYQTMSAQEFREKTAQEKKPLGSWPAAKPTLTGVVRDVAPDPQKPFTAPGISGGRKVTYQITPPAASSPVPQEPPARVQRMEAPAEPAAPVVQQLPVTREPAPRVAEKKEPAVPAEEVQQQLEQPRIPWRVVGEVLQTYIICEDEDQNVWLIDKHAAHERLRFDALKAGSQPVMSQQLLTPVPVSLGGEEYAAVLEHAATLAELGFVCEDFGGDTVVVREIPADIRLEDVTATVEELARKLVLGSLDPAGLRDELYHTMACKSAIKAGMKNHPAELAALAEKVQSGEIRYCPHGRPVAVRLSRYELEKMFKRA